MICPKCKTNVDDNSEKCPNCDVLLKYPCPKCATLNRINNRFCQNCRAELIVFCPKCNCANFSIQKTCRKCGTRLPNSLQKPKLTIKQKIYNYLNDENIKVIGISSNEGGGKSSLVATIYQNLFKKFNILYAHLDSFTQIAPYGLLVKLILNYFNFPSFIKDLNEFKKRHVEFFKDVFCDLNQDEIDSFINILYPSQISEFENILTNKEKINKIFKKILTTITSSQQTLILVDDFDLVDASSYELLNEFINESYFVNNLNNKVIVTYKNHKNIEAFLYCKHLNENNYKNLTLNTVNELETYKIIDVLLGGGKDVMPNHIKHRIYELSFGSKAYIEEVILYLKDMNMFSYQNNNCKLNDDIDSFVFPQNIIELLKLRLNNLNEVSKISLKTLCIAALFGNFFNIKILYECVKTNDKNFNTIINFLKSKGFIKQIDSINYMFKNSTIWQIIYEYIKQDKKYKLYNSIIFKVLNKYILSNTTLRPLIAQNISDETGFKHWEWNKQLSAYLGDVNLYVISQKQCLRHVKNLNFEGKATYLNESEIQLGKLLYEKSPNEAIKLLSKNIDIAKKQNNKLKVVDLCSYFVEACKCSQNYLGLIETIDLVLSCLDENTYNLEKAIIKSKQLTALFNIGNYSQIVNLVENEILPYLEEALLNNGLNPKIPKSIIFNTWLNANLKLIDSLAICGNNRFLDKYDDLKETIKLNNIKDNNFEARLKVAEAFYLSFSGEIINSDKILNEIAKTAYEKKLDPKILSIVNLVLIINRILIDDFEYINKNLLSYTMFANNTNDDFSKNMLKSILGLTQSKQNNDKKAYDILTQQLKVFVNDKIAIGALFCWYLIAQLSLKNNEYEKSLEIAKKALNIAKNPKINNNIFVILYKILIAKIYIQTENYTNAKMYLEKALKIAAIEDLKYLNLKITLAYATIYENMLKDDENNKSIIIKNICDLYKKALKIAQKLNIDNIILSIEERLETYNSVNM